MSTSKIAITIDEKLLQELDRLVKARMFPNRSKAFQEAVSDKLIRINSNRLARECQKLDRHFERETAEEGFNSELESWPEY